MARIHLTLFCVILVVVACGAETDPVDEQPGVDDPAESVTGEVSYSKGTVLELSDGAMVRIPPYAVRGSGTVTFSRLSCAGISAGETFSSCLYEVQGDVALVNSYYISLPADPVKPSPYCILARTEEGLLCLGGSAVSAAPNEGATSLFTQFLLASTAETKERQANVITDFLSQMCRTGDVRGKWEVLFALGSMDALTAGHESYSENDWDTCSASTYYDASAIWVGGMLNFTGVDGPDPRFLMLRKTNSYVIYRHQVIARECMIQTHLGCSPDLCTESDGVCTCFYAESSGSTVTTAAYVTDDEGRWYSPEYGGIANYCVMNNLLFVMGAGPVLKIYGRVTTAATSSP